MSEVRQFIQDEIIRIDGDENKDGAVYLLDEICGNVRDKFKVQCTHSYIGGFDSPGYDLNCYAIAFINEEGTLEIYELNHEMY